MRVFFTAIGGALAVGALLATHVACSGCLAAATLLLAYFVAIVAVGLTVAAFVNRREDRSLRGGPSRRFTGHCHECGRSMLQTGPVWICPTCDRAPAHYFVGRRRRRD